MGIRPVLRTGYLKVNTMRNVIKDYIQKLQRLNTNHKNAQGQPSKNIDIRPSANNIPVLKPCPFCGGQAKMLVPKKATALNRNVKRPSCTECGATIFIWKSQERAVQEWNRRVSNN